MITILINLNEKLIVKKLPNRARIFSKTAKQNQIIVYAFVSSNLFCQLNRLTELTRNFACFFPYSSVQKQKKKKKEFIVTRFLNCKFFFNIQRYFSMVIFPKLYTFFPPQLQSQLNGEHQMLTLQER